MIDLFGTKTVINVKTKIGRELMLPTLKSKIVDLSMANVGDKSVFVLSFEDGAFACLGSDGNPIRITATSLFGQSVLANQERFWARENIQKVPTNSKFKSDLKHCSWLLSGHRLFYFTGLDVQNLTV
jgi:hypothetical protein